MSDFIYGNGPVPETKHDPDPAPPDTTGYVTAADLNLFGTNELSIRQAILSGQYHGLTNTPSAPVSGASAANVRALAGRIQFSQGGLAWADASVYHDVVQYGADPTGVADSGPAVNAAIQAAVADGRPVLWGAGNWNIATSLNLTGIAGIVIVGQGKHTRIFGKCANQPVFDLVGSHWVFLIDLWIEGDATNMPSVGVLAGRTTGDASAGLHWFHNLQITGRYGRSSYIGVSSEQNIHDGQFSYENFQPGASCCCVWANNLQTTSTSNPAGGNYPAISSPYATLSNTPSGGNTVHYFSGGQMGMDSSSSDHYASTLEIESVRGFTMLGTFLYGPGSKGIWIRGAGASFMNLVAAKEDELTTQYGLYIDGSATVEDIDIDGFLGGSSIYAEDGSVMERCRIRGRWGVVAASYNADVATIKDSTLFLSQLDVRVRTRAEDVDFGLVGNISLPAYPNTVGCRYVLVGPDPAGSGQTLHIESRNNDAKYIDRFESMQVTSPCIQQKPYYSASVSGTFTPDFWAAAGYDLTLTGNATIANPTSSPVGNSGLAQDFAKFTFIFRQDPTGGRTVTLGSNFKGTDTFAVDPFPNSATRADFVLGSDGKYWMTYCNSNGNENRTVNNLTVNGTLFTAASRRICRLVTFTSLTLDSRYEAVCADTSGASGNIVLTLPDASDAGTGALRETERTLDSSHRVSVAPTGSDTIAYGGNNAVFLERGSNALWRSDGISNWELVRYYPGQMVATANRQMEEFTTQLLCDTSGGGFTATLPPALTSIRTMPYTVKRKTGDTNNLIVSAGSSTIEGAGSVTLTTAFAWLTVICDSSEYYVIGKG